MGISLGHPHLFLHFSLFLPYSLMCVPSYRPTLLPTSATLRQYGSPPSYLFFSTLCMLPCNSLCPSHHMLILRPCPVCFSTCFMTPCVFFPHVLPCLVHCHFHALITAFTRIFSVSFRHHTCYRPFTSISFPALCHSRCPCLCPSMT